MNLENIILPPKTKNILIKKYPNKLERTKKIDIAENFIELYKSKLKTTILKNQNKSFKEINRMTLVSLADEKANAGNEYFKYIKERDIIRVDKPLEEPLLDMLKLSHKIEIDDETSLVKEDGKIVLKY